MKKTFLFSFFFFTVSFALRAQIADSSVRQIKLQGAVNFRDLGGYQATDGRHIKWHCLYRSADISRLTDGDLALLKAAHIGSVVDLRGVEESKKAPDRLNPGTDYILCPAGSDNNLNDWMRALSSLRTTGEGDSMMKAYYSKTEFLADRYRPFFEKLLRLPQDDALLFHCTAGKDRTGIGAALLLSALGIPEKTILEDYTATDYYRKAENEKMIASLTRSMHIDPAVAMEIASARPEWLGATLEAIRSKYGSLQDFLSGPLGLDPASLALLRNKFLE